MSPWFILATGPSQAQSDVDAVRGLGTVVAVNNAVFMAPWADILYAADPQWWKHYKPDWFQGERLTFSHRAREFGAKRVPTEDGEGFGRTRVRSGTNSGFQAVNLAIIRGAETICLLGFDHQHTGGRIHCHDDHPGGEMWNARYPGTWVRRMEEAAKDTFGVKIINCSRQSALNCFPRMTLAEFIKTHVHH